jgi:glycosyltransferase involved in cell wall biosynthesis
MTQKPLRILHLATHSGIAGGGAVQMARMAIGLKQHGHHVVCGFDRSGSGAGVGNFGRLQENGIVCETFRMKSLWSTLFGESKRFRAFVESQQFDIIHCHKPRALRFALDSLSGGKSTPAIVAQRGNCYPLDAHVQRLFSDERVRAIVCVAEQVREIVIAGGIAPEKVVTIYGGVNPDEFDFTIDPLPVRAELGLPVDAPVVGIVANFDGKKAHEKFFEAAALIAEKIPDVRFLVVGRGAPAEVPAHLAELGIADRVLLAGFREDVPRMLAAMDVSVNFSDRGEGLTGAMRESLCMKKPVVCTDVGGNRELVRDGETGRLIAPGDVPGFVEAIVELLQNPTRAEFLGESGYDLIQRQFTVEVQVKRLEELYFSLTASIPATG